MKCLHCNKEFAKNRPQQQFCCRSCLDKSKSKDRQVREYFRKIGLEIVYTKNCFGCGLKIESVNAGVKACCESCKPNLKEIIKRRHYQLKPKTEKTKVCLICGKEFKRVSKREIGEYCSSSCYHKTEKGKARRIRENEKRKAKYIKKITQKHKSESAIRKKVAGAFRARIHKLIRSCGSVKDQNTFNLLGYTKSDLIRCLFNQFEFGMTWENYGKEWHIDHIKPVSWFKFTDENKNEQLRRCFALSNLKPRWATSSIARKYGSDMDGNVNKSNRYRG
jgi:hypothetical protein